MAAFQKSPLRIRVRDAVPWVVILVGLGLLAGIAWLTRNPEAAFLREVEDRRFLGPLATWFREQYLPPQDADRSVDEPRPPAVSTGTEDQAPWAPWRPPSLPPAGEREIVWVLPGTKLYRAPTTSAPVVRDFTAISNAIKLERRGDWFRVHYAGSEGWAFLEGYDESGGPPYGEAPVPPKALAPPPVNEDTLALARTFLAGRERVARVGPYPLYTDSDDGELIRYLDRLVQQLEALYESRYGCRPVGEPRAALVLYRSELTYRLLERRSERIAGLHSAGHAAGGLAVLYVADLGKARVGATVVHELVHFLNRRAIGPALPPWLDEGLADDLAMARVGPDGRLDPTGLGGERRQRGDTLRVDGGLATLKHVRDAMRGGRLPPLRRLLELDWDGFVRSEQSQLHYGASAFWVRYLLDGEDGRLAVSFRRFLADVAAGGPASPEALRRRLGRGWSDLDAGFHAWIAAHPPRNVLVPAQEARTRGSSSRQTEPPPA